MWSTLYHTMKCSSPLQKLHTLAKAFADIKFLGTTPSTCTSTLKLNKKVAIMFQTSNRQQDDRALNGLHYALLGSA